MKGISTRGVFMDAEKLKQMDASEAVWMCVQMSGKRRRELEEELELVPGQIDRWSSRKDHHSPSLAALPELVEATSCGADPAQNVLIQWILARVADGNLKYDPKGMSADQMLHEIVHLGSEFGRVASTAIDAGQDGKFSRVEALRIKTASADVIARCQALIHGVEPYI